MIYEKYDCGLPLCYSVLKGHDKLTQVISRCGMISLVNICLAASHDFLLCIAVSTFLPNFKSMYLKTTDTEMRL